jgi:hypothetical protein
MDRHLSAGLSFVRAAWLMAAAISVIALVWATTIAPSVIGKTSFAEIFRSYKMKSMEVELAREMGGLLIMGIWLGCLAFVSKRRQ